MNEPLADQVCVVGFGPDGSLLLRVHKDAVRYVLGLIGEDV